MQSVVIPQYEAPPQRMESITGRIAYWAMKAPGKLAVDDGNQLLTFAELDSCSNRLAQQLIKAGAGPETCVGLLLERSVDFVVAMVATLKAGAAYLPLDPATPAERANLILADAAAAILITHRRKAGGVRDGGWRVVDFHADVQSATPELSASIGHSDLPDVSEVPKDRLAYVIYTSGSSGHPKGVEITHGNLLHLIHWHERTFEITSADRISQVAGLGFDAAGWEIWPALTGGASLLIADETTRRSPQALRDWLLAERITVSFVPTVIAEQLLHLSWPSNTALRLMLTGADTLHRRPATGLPFAFINNYGLTECTVVSTSGLVEPDDGIHDKNPGTPTIGKPILHTTVLILDETLRPVPHGQPGELCIGGELVGRGYRNLSELTARCFVMVADASGEPLRVYRTGDRARLLPDGQIAFLGRLDDQVKIRGYRIELGEIVSCLDRFPRIEGSAVVVRESSAGPELVAYLVITSGVALPGDDLREFLNARLPEYMVPAQFVIVPTLPLTPNGKLDKSALPAPDQNNVLKKGSAPGDLLPNEQKTDVHGRVEKIVAELLNQTAVRPDDNFFMIGGHSMLGVQLVARLRDAFGVRLSLRQLFGAPTITALATEVARLSAAGAALK